MTLSSLTNSARELVLNSAKYDIELATYLALARSNRRSRAIDFVTVYGSTGCVRRYSDALTGKLIDTESAKYPMTRHAQDAIARHREEARAYVREHHADLIAEITAAVQVAQAA